MIDLVLIHGWGLSHKMWDRFVNNLLKIRKDINIHYLSPYDLADDNLNLFIEQYQKQNDSLIIMGHSLGGLKMLSSNIINIADAIILVNSFTKFTRSDDFKHGINPKILSMMIKKLAKDSKEVLNDFLKNTNILNHLENTDYMNNIKESDLLLGLKDLQNIDCRKLDNIKDSHKNNIYNINGGCDPLISTFMQNDMLKNSPIHNIIYENAEHFIPYTHSDDLVNHLMKIINSLSNEVVSNFNSKSISYDNNAQIQELISNKLIHYVNTHENINVDKTKKILELGCGTGLFTKQLVKNFPQSHIISTDLSFNMLKQNQLRLYDLNNENDTDNMKNIKFKQVNALTEMNNFADDSFDLICSSMLFQWFEDPIKILKSWQSKLKPEGIFAISLLGDQSFDHINNYIKTHNFNSIFNKYPNLDYFHNHGLDVYEDDCYFDYDNLKALLKTMINTGANHNKNDKKSNQELKLLLKQFNTKITIKWNSIFLIGRII